MRRCPRGDPGMGEAQFLVRRGLKQATPLQAESFPNAALRSLKRRIHVIGRAPDEIVRQIGEQPLELLPVFEFFMQIIIHSVHRVTGRRAAPHYSVMVFPLG